MPWSTEAWSGADETIVTPRLVLRRFRVEDEHDLVVAADGFVIEGVGRRAVFKDGRFLDSRTFARLSE